MCLAAVVRLVVEKMIEGGGQHLLDDPADLMMVS